MCIRAWDVQSIVLTLRRDKAEYKDSTCRYHHWEILLQLSFQGIG